MKRSRSSLVFSLVLVLSLTSLIGACASPAANSSTSAATISSASATATTSATSAAAPPKPTGELVAAVSSLGSEQFFPWRGSSDDCQMILLVNEAPIYYEESTGKHIPGLVEAWEESADHKTTTFHIRKGISWHDGWGEVTADDLKFNFERLCGPKAGGIKFTAAKQIDSMEVRDQYILVINLKSPQAGWWQNWSMGLTGNGMGIVCKKYVESVGDDVAAQKPIGSGPYKLIEQKFGDHYTFEAYDQHWRVVPEFKYVTLRVVPELSTQVAMLKTKEIDLASVTGEMLPELKAAGLATESNPYGGMSIVLLFGGMLDPTIDKRFIEGYHLQDPWKDINVRKAMNLAIDREAIAKAVFGGAATPMGVPIATQISKKYQYPYDPTTARQLLTTAGYPEGFTFEFYSYPRPGLPELPRMIEAIAGYWTQIGLNPKIVNSDWTAYLSEYMSTMKTAGKIAIMKYTYDSDPMLKVVPNFTPEVTINPNFEDAASYAMYQESRYLSDADARMDAVDKLQKYWHDNYAVIPSVRVPLNFAWNPEKISPFAHQGGNQPFYLEYVRHAQPLNTFRLFSIWEGR